MAHVTFDRFNEIRNQVVASGQLYIDLGKRIPDAVAKIDKIVVDTYYERDQRRNDCEEYQK